MLREKLRRRFVEARNFIHEDLVPAENSLARIILMRKSLPFGLNERIDREGFHCRSPRRDHSKLSADRAFLGRSSVADRRLVEVVNTNRGGPIQF